MHKSYTCITQWHYKQADLIKINGCVKRLFFMALSLTAWIVFGKQFVLQIVYYEYIEVVILY